MKKQFIKKVISLVTVMGLFIGCLPDTSLNVVAATQYVDTSEYESLAEVYKDYFKVGAACEAIDHWNDPKKEIGNEAKEQLILSCFNSITCGNEMKPAYNFNSSSDRLFKIDRAADEMMNWATEGGTNMRGHVLVWHGQTDPSIFAKDFVALSGGIQTRSDSATLDEDCLVDRETLIERMRTYIYAMMEYTYEIGYAKTIYAWDVVNEAVDEGYDDGLRRSYWYKIIGPEFLYYAFLFAREAEVMYSVKYAEQYGLDPEGDLSSIRPKLIYNDYNEWFSRRVDIVVDFTTQRQFNGNHAMVQSDVINPDGDGTIYGDGLIDAIGMQGHLSDTNKINEYITALKRYSEAVGEVQITELDVGCNHTGENKFYYQAVFYYDFFSALVQAVKDGANLSSVTFWGLTDDASWRSESDPLLFNADLSVKPAYYAVLMAGKGEEFNLTIAQSIVDLTDFETDFMPVSTGGTVIENTGFKPRGTGHKSQLVLAPRINHTEGEGLGYSLRVMRTEQDATVMFDASKFSGQNVTITAYVMTTDSEVRMGLETGDTIELAKTGTVADEWVPISVNYDIPEGLSSVMVYFETDGAADLYIDDVSIYYTREGEEPAPVVPMREVLPGKDTDNLSDDADSDASIEVTYKSDASGSDEIPGKDTDLSKDITITPNSGSDNGTEEDAEMTTKGVIVIFITAALAAVVVVLLKKKQNAKKDM